MSDTSTLQAFAQLPVAQQTLIEKLAIFYGHSAVSNLSRFLDFGFETKALRAELSALAEQGWVRVDEVGKTRYYRCHEDVRDALTRHAIDNGRFEAIARAIQQQFGPNLERAWSYRTWDNAEAALRDLRIAILRGEVRLVYRLLQRAMQQYYNSPKFNPSPWVTLWGMPLDDAWLPYLAAEVLLTVLAPSYLNNALRLDIEVFDTQYLWEDIQKVLPQLDDNAPIWLSLGGTYTTQWLWRKQLDEGLAQQATNHESGHYAYWLLLQAVAYLAKGDSQQASETYQAALKLWRKILGKRNVWFESELEYLGWLALLLDGDTKALKLARSALKVAPENPNIYVLQHFLKAREQGNVSDMDTPMDFHVYTPLSFLLTLWVKYWLGQNLNKKWCEQAEQALLQLEDKHYPWLVDEYVATLARILPAKHPHKQAYQQRCEACYQAGALRPMIDLFQRQEAWQLSLQALQQLGATSSGNNNTQANSEERMIWQLQKLKNADFVSYDLTPKVQKKSRKGWTAGRQVALRRLLEEPESFPFMSAEDRSLAQAVQSESFSYYGRGHYYLSMNQAWRHLIGHPRVFWEDAPNTPLDIQQGKEELQIVKERGKLRITLSPELPTTQHFEAGEYWVEEETAQQLRVYLLSQSVLQLQQILGAKGLLVPQDAEQEVRQTLEKLAPLITIQSDIAGMDNAEEVGAEQHLHVYLLPYDEGLRFLMRVQPLGSAGPAFPPGHGRSNVMAEIAGRLVKTTRALKQEKQQAQQVLQACPALEYWEDPSEDYALDDPQDCLEALSELKAQAEQVSLAWPEGEKLRLTPALDASGMRLNIKKSGDWFELDGQLQVSDDLVLTLKQLLELEKSSSGRFIPLEDGQFLQLTRQFQKRLDALRSYAENSKQGVKVGALAAPALEDFMEEVGELKADKAWQQQVKKLKTIRDSQPSVPSDLQADLRDYQEDGFRWMMRLAEWGVGGCLADDMGLGKTVQALAMLVARATQGAALVVAPTSVCHNWYHECQRFAPTLRPVFYRGKARQDLLDGVQAHDLVIVSYTLLQQDAQAFQGLQWASIILDEAQAIKNAQTKRAQAAYQLQGDFRLATTGTPIENRLSELWSLFRFLNPGLLFAQKRFNERFANLIERDQDDKARQNLKKLVQPFILRRTKNQVLQELPPRTEITLTVSLSDSEMALYEAMRQQALERFAHSDDVNNKHLEVLAEITRLRLAACHPRLAMSESELPSSKLQAFAELVTELRDNQHKALVFSQFVKHLELIRHWLDEQQIPYQYLDGSTPAEKRQQAVEAFQRGEGDIFLISLKAGGFGLNLTAADYVIHMDPWWNPAVEDQASDRAHRIGQQRPVTIYRLVSEHTIEEKIVKLHQQKRDLANSLLAGSESSGQLSAAAMLDLIRGEAVEDVL